ncbi:cytochrome P460 family protein [Pseudoalteromonas sp. Of7M-16]|uniref:cytochrome P460 family protein n=1 Tax=Pseudoalteromonas sp. Of7M-16 TaxID=2917756 RepID=UPI001EF5A8A9|nr:cytochrome P460 family protein [Pseudoalteromonas sp. Of7M-16]MCG7547601.1 cytochrome P460 family protein [Pseudoalteromonas sp. Of7M-16]
MTRIIQLLCVLLSLHSFTVSADPFNVYPFKVPDKYKAALKNYRTKWHRMTGFEHSGLHWQQFIVVFLNQDAKVYEQNYLEYLRYYQDYDEEEEDEDEIAEPNFKVYSPGTIVLKENFSSVSGAPHDALTITMMIKREKGYSKGFGDWEYVQFDKEGNIVLAGKGSEPMIKQMCSNCHASIEERDFIFANFYSRKK